MIESISGLIPLKAAKQAAFFEIQKSTKVQQRVQNHGKSSRILDSASRIVDSKNATITKKLRFFNNTEKTKMVLMAGLERI